MQVCTELEQQAIDATFYTPASVCPILPTYIRIGDSIGLFVACRLAFHEAKGRQKVDICVKFASAPTVERLGIRS